MFGKVQLITLLFAVLCATGDISVGPSNRVTPSTDVKITCSVNRNQNPRAYVIWKRQIGSFTVDLGTNVGLKQDFSSRYSLDVESSGGVDTFSLSIKDAKYEDTGTFECKRGYEGTEGVSSFGVLAVCDDTDSQSCKCIESEGWGNPTCFEQPEDAQKVIDRHKDAIIGVVVCLIIAIVYGVIVSIMLSRDCLTRMKLKAEKKLEAMQHERRIPEDDASTRYLNDSREMYYEGNFPESKGSSLYHIPHSNHPAEADFYEKIPTESNHQVSVHHQREKQAHDNRAFDSDEVSYNQLKQPASEGDRLSPNHSAGLSDSSSDSYGHGARPKSSQHHLKPPQSHNAPDIGYQQQQQQQHKQQPVAQSPHQTRQTGRQNLPQSGSRSPRITNRNQEPVTMNTTGATTPNQASHSKKRQAPYPGQDNKSNFAGKGALGKYDTYESGLPTISQQVPSNPTPQSTHSEQLAHSPGDTVAVQQRGAYTDVSQDKSGENQRNGYGARGHYTQPRKLDYVHGNASNTHNVMPRKGAYVSETDTMI